MHCYTIASCRLACYYSLVGCKIVDRNTGGFRSEIVDGRRLLCCYNTQLMYISVNRVALACWSG